MPATLLVHSWTRALVHHLENKRMSRPGSFKWTSQSSDLCIIMLFLWRVLRERVYLVCLNIWNIEGFNWLCPSRDNDFSCWCILKTLSFTSSSLLALHPTNACTSYKLRIFWELRFGSIKECWPRSVIALLCIFDEFEYRLRYYFRLHFKLCYRYLCRRIPTET